MNKEEELILVVPKKCFDNCGAFQGFNPEGEKYLKELIDTQSAYFTKRGPAEKDPSMKQIIPYCIVMQNGNILVYKRGKTGGEDRLKSLYSCGIGGHINPIDSSEETVPFNRTSLKRALQREITEEILIPKNNPSKTINTATNGGINSELDYVKFTTAGLINDDSNSVGQVHLGLVEIAQIPEGPVAALEEAISDLKFISPNELIEKRENLESWSQIVADNLHQILNKI
jgi:predicted NUDIX family phosphoesterase